MKRRKTGFESFAYRFFVVCLAVSVFGIIAIKSIESTYNRDYQKIENEIETLKSEIDSLEIQKQELVDFERLTDIAFSKGYVYQSGATTASKSNNSVVND